MSDDDREEDRARRISAGGLIGVRVSGPDGEDPSPAIGAADFDLPDDTAEETVIATGENWHPDPESE